MAFVVGVSSSAIENEHLKTSMEVIEFHDAYLLKCNQLQKQLLTAYATSYATLRDKKFRADSLCLELFLHFPFTLNSRWIKTIVGVEKNLVGGECR